MCHCGKCLGPEDSEHFAVEISLNYYEAALCNILCQRYQKNQHANQYVKIM